MNKMQLCESVWFILRNISDKQDYMPNLDIFYKLQKEAKQNGLAAWFETTNKKGREETTNSHNQEMTK